MILACSTIIITTCIICFTLNHGVNITITHVHEIKNAIATTTTEVVSTNKEDNDDGDNPPTLDDVLREINNFVTGEDNDGR